MYATSKFVNKKGFERQRAVPHSVEEPSLSGRIRPTSATVGYPI